MAERSSQNRIAHAATLALGDSTRNFPVLIRLYVEVPPARSTAQSAGLEWMVRDVVRGSGAECAAEDKNTLSVQFSSLHLALMACRRLEWAASGFAEARDGVLSMLVLHPDELKEARPQELFQAMSAGQVQVSARAVDEFGMAPGFRLGRGLNAGWCELLWRTPGVDASRAADEKSLERQLRTAGREYLDAASAQRFEERGETKRSSSGRLAGNKRWLYWAGGVSVTIAMGLGTAFWMQGAASSKKPSSSAPVEAPVKTQAPASSSAQVPMPTAAAPSSHSAGKCTLSAGQVKGKLEKAESDLYGGNYKASMAEYRAVLACDPANADAVSGLKKVRQYEQLAEGKTGAP